MEIATFGAGCFWCVEAVFADIKGVYQVLPGYMGGHVDKPTYKDVCTGHTGHAEVAQISFNPNEISYASLLEVFFKTHDPTSVNRQGNDIGTQYRSAVFYHSDTQKEILLQAISTLEGHKVFEEKIVTQVSPAGEFFQAEDYHHNYFKQNGEEMYCKMVVRPKVEKFQKAFAHLLINS